MKMKIDVADNFIDVWSEEKGIWERYVKIELEKEHKIPEKLQGSCDMTTSEICRMNNIEVKINEILDYLEGSNE